LPVLDVIILGGGAGALARGTSLPAGGERGIVDAA
jgi:hypothetical protein